MSSSNILELVFAHSIVASPYGVLVINLFGAYTKTTYTNLTSEPAPYKGHYTNLFVFAKFILTMQTFATYTLNVHHNGKISVSLQSWM